MKEITTPLSSISLTYSIIALLLLAHPSSSLHGSFHSFRVDSLSPSTVCNQSSKGKEGASLRVVNKHGPCNELLKHEKGAEISADHHEEMLLRDQRRVNSMHARFSKNKAAGAQFKQMQTEIPIQSGIPLGIGDYVATLSLGTPKKDYTLLLDTGSDITWTQCEPCVGSCYQQSQPKFDPSKSSSYRNVSCSSQSCSLVTNSGAAKGCQASTCLYKVQYGDGSYSVGFFASEKLTIGTSDVLGNFLFGCGQNNNGLLGRSAGILGLGPSKLSLALQTGNKYDKLFTYCLPSTSGSSAGHLTFGGRLPKSVKFTPFSPDFEGTPFYGIDITGITVGGYKLPISESVFAKAGAISDSGTVITRLQPSVYSVFRSKFQEFMKNYPRTTGVSILDTCYDLSGYTTVTVPKISFIFKGGVEVEIQVFGILREIKGAKQICLAFAENDDDDEFTIFGNSQQQTLDVVHDLGNRRLGFSPAGCS